MAPKKKPSSMPIPIGNCEVVVEAKSFKSESDDQNNILRISLSKNVNVQISVVEKSSKKNCDDPQNHITGSLRFVLINSKDDDSQAQSQLQDVLNLYVKELPAMNFAANTGKHSTFLKRCVSNGKYCTLLLKSNSMEHPGEVVAAITYQIIPTDTRFAEVPLAAVSSTYQKKGIGTFMYRELRNRLQNVGTRTIFCWGDAESEGFWFKQGFVSKGEVDNKDKARKLRIKTDIRKALCFPGGATLLVSDLSMDNSVNSEDSLNICLRDLGESEAPQAVVNQSEPRTKLSLSEELEKNHSQSNGTGIQVIADLDNLARCNTSIATKFTGNGADADAKQYLTSSPSQKKRVWESSCTSLQSKKVRGGYQVDNLDSMDFITKCNGKNSEHKSSSSSSGHRSFFDGRGSFSSELMSSHKSFTIMLMDIADDAKKSILSKIIEDLGGSVTSEGSLSTHVVAGKVRKTLNFCTALCSGAWIISPNWLKESCRKGKFVDEMGFILKDEDYKLKYQIELNDAVLRARNRRTGLFNGYKICLAAHLQPPVHGISAIVKSSGGDVLRGLAKVKEVTDTIYLASEEDMEEAMCAMKRGIKTFSCDWFMNCIMRQEIDLDAPQFAESL